MKLVSTLALFFIIVSTGFSEGHDEALIDLAVSSVKNSYSATVASKEEVEVLELVQREEFTNEVYKVKSKIESTGEVRNFIVTIRQDYPFKNGENNSKDQISIVIKPAKN